MRGLAGMAAIAVALAACGSGDASVPGDLPGSEPVQATAQDAEWRLVIDAPRSVWLAGEPIAVTAAVHWIGAGDGTTYYAAGAGPLVFGVAELGGRRLDGLRTGDCAVHEIRAGEPFATGFVKSGAFEPGDPSAAFYRAFLDDPQLRLPAGLWEVRADVELYMPPAWCAGRIVRLEAAIVLDVR